MSVTEIVIGTGILTGAMMVAVTPWYEIMEMIWGATADSINTGGTYFRGKLEESGPVGKVFSRILGFAPLFALGRLAVNKEAREDLQQCSNIKVDSFSNFWNRIGCGSKAVFWGK